MSHMLTAKEILEVNQSSGLRICYIVETNFDRIPKSELMKLKQDIRRCFKEISTANKYFKVQKLVVDWDNELEKICE